MAGSGTSSRTRVTRKGKGVKVTTGGSTTAKRAKGPVKRTKQQSPSHSESEYEYEYEDDQSDNTSSEDVPNSTTSAKATNDNHGRRVVYDKAKFVSSKAYRLFNTVLKNRRVLYEREVHFTSLKNDFVDEICELHNCRQLMSFSGDGYPQLVRLFYSNITNYYPHTFIITTKVYGKKIVFSADALCTAFGLRRESNAVIPYEPLPKWPKPTHPPPIPKPQELYQSLCVEGSNYVNNAPIGSLKSNYGLLYKVLCGTLLHTTYSSGVALHRAELLYALVHDLAIDIPALVVKNVYEASTDSSPRAGLPHGHLIFHFIKNHCGVAIPSDEPTEQGAPRIDQSTLNKSQSQLKKAKVAQSTVSQPSTSAPSEPGGSNADIPPGPVSNQTLSNQLAELINLVKMQTSRLDRIEQALTAHGILAPQDDIAATAQGHGRGP